VNLATTLAGQGEHVDAVVAYQKAFALDPALVIGPFINHEYGFTLVHAGRPDEAVAIFDRMKREAPPPVNARGFRSMALLEMLRGRYAAAEREIRGAIALDQSHDEALSEFRDRLYLITTLDARGRQAATVAEWRALDRLVSTKLSLSPDWALLALRAHAHRGRVADARRYLDRMRASLGRATADSGVARNLDNDQMLMAVAEAEVDMAEGRTASALARLEPAHLYFKDPASLATLAAAYAASDRRDEAIAKYEELLSRAPFGNEPQQVWLEAHLALGKLYERERPTDARQTYDALLTRWKDADEDVLLLREVVARRQPLDPDGVHAAPPRR
jgi:tetratricopeptide (TPR) repeat protein